MDRLGAMQTFVCVVETGSFSAAARRLRIGQPAVSKTVAQLEDRLRVRLLTRSTRGLMPTEAGQAFFERAKRTLEEADEADNAARGAAAGLSGTLRVSAPVTFARMHILPHLAAFLEQHPHLDIDLQLDDRLVNLVEEGIDVALRLGDLRDSGLTARKIGACRRRVLATPRYFERYGEPGSPEDLANHQAVIYGLGVGRATWQFMQGDVEQSVTVNGRVRVSAAEGVRVAVLADLGLSLSSEWMFAPELANGTVRPTLQDWQLPDMDLWALLPAGRMASAKARAFIGFVERLLSTSHE
ncbi:LysR family transcriptional regulator [Pseudomonas sp. SZMC_28357]|uniref:LysR family transcriptional regulator n=1 Tax=Pseudomonas sp. SZMC_28357 TaxID=3074380 RepID=UPI002871B6CA|nr:LysR family transcriptional regulator [Pseudomonas sp. SZMC_28357]MDR9751781.1 LysR family transcriptional regulator [Pseudomonas sp. SZMC_28357]